MRVNKQDKGTKYVPFPTISYPQAMGFRIEPDIRAFSRALGIPTGHTAYYQGAYGSHKMVRKDIACILNHNPMLIFTFNSDQEVRDYYRANFGEDMDEFYAKNEPAVVEHKPDVLTLPQYPAYVSMLGIKNELAIRDEKSTIRILRDIHSHYGIETKKSLSYHRETNSCNRLVVYRKEIAHILLYPNIGDGIKVKLMDQEGTWENLVALAKEAGVYALYPYKLEEVKP